MSDVLIEIKSIVGSPICISADDGEKVYIKIAESIKAGKQVQLSFEDIEDITSAFLNSAIGQLYGDFSEETLKKYMLPPINASEDDLEILKRVVERAKQFFKDKELYLKAQRDVMGEQDG